MGADACLQCLSGLRGEVSAALGIPEVDLELSMGMSGDFEQAVCFSPDSLSTCEPF